MKTTIEFSEEEQHYASVALDIATVVSDLRDFYQSLRAEWKYQDGVPDKLYEEFCQKFTYILDEF